MTQPIERSDVLYETNSAFGRIKVLNDLEDEGGLPIGLVVGQRGEGVAWLSREAGIELAEAILEDSNVQPEVLVATGDQCQDFNLAAIQLAKQHGTQVIFRYAKGSSGAVLETRSVQPVVSIESHDGDIVAVGFDRDRDDYRAFRLDRIGGVVQVGG